MTILAAYSIKGGVGKTAGAVNLAYLAAKEGARVLIWDLDPQGAATFYFRVRPKIKGGGKRLIRGKQDPEVLIRGTDYEGLDLLPADFSYRHLDLALEQTAAPRRGLVRVLDRLAPDYDFVFLDCAPSISLVSESVFAAADALLVPTIPTTLSMRTLEQLREHLQRSGPDRLLVLPYLCMADNRKALHRKICELAGHAESGFLRTRIPYSSLVEKMGLHRAPLATYGFRSAPARAYEELWSEIKERCPGKLDA